MAQNHALGRHLVVALLTMAGLSLGSGSGPVRAESSDQPGAPATSEVLAVGGTHACAILTDGSVRCWGVGSTGQLGHGGTTTLGDGPGEMGNALAPVDIGTGRSAVSLANGAAFSCALLDDGGVKCWGNNLDGQLGQGDTVARGDSAGEMGDDLDEIDLGGRATAISASGSTVCALLDTGEVVCFGDNATGGLGRGDKESIGDEPGEMGDALVRVPLRARATSVSVGGRFVCALLKGGRVTCWGFNSTGQLGLGDDSDRGDDPGEMGVALPLVDIGGSALAVSAGQKHACALRADGSVVCWGSGAHGATGLGSEAFIGDDPNEMGDALQPVDLGTDQPAIGVSAGFDTTCVLLADHTAKCFGDNASGHLGLGDVSARGDDPGEMGGSLPNVDLGINRPLSVITEGTMSCAVLANARVKCWGNGPRLGLGTTTNRGDGPDEMGRHLSLVDLGEDVGRPEVQIAATASESAVVEKDGIHFTVTLRNTGTITLTAVTVSSAGAPLCGSETALIRPAASVTLTCSGTTHVGDGPVLTTPFIVTTDEDASDATTVSTKVRKRSFRADALVRRANGGFVGDEIYNRTGKNQSRTARVRSGDTAHFTVEIQNDGNVEQRIRIAAPAETSEFAVRYRRAGKDVTAKVVAGTLRTGSLQPGRSEHIDIVVKPRASAGSGDRFTARVTATGSTGARDVVKALTRRR